MPQLVKGHVRSGRMVRPYIRAGPASHYEAPNERIVEFGAEGKGGLMSVKSYPNGEVQVDLYRLDDGVGVTVDKKHLILDQGERV